MRQRSSRLPVRGGPCAALLAGVLTLAACDAPEPAAPVSPPPEPGAVASGGKPSTGSAIGPEVASPATPAAESRIGPDASSAPPAGLSGQVWRVRESTAVEPGTAYTFLEGGTLVIDAPNGTPLYGQWTHQEGALHLTEEGVSYRTEILEISEDRLRLLSLNPGEPVEITLEPDPGVPLPPQQPQQPQPGTGGAR